MPEEPQNKLVRFDFPPGATPKQIAESLRAAWERIVLDRDGKPPASPSGDEPTRFGEQDVVG